MTYTYKCVNCDTVTEQERGINDEPLKECPECKGKVEMKFSATPFIAKCNGFFGKSK